MPRVQVDGLNLYYETAGSGPVVLLVGGLGADGHFWYKQTPALAERFTVIVPDNRDTGRSDTPDESYTVRTLAEDLRGFLDALEVPVAHIVGASGGGFIAQEFGLAHPGRVARMVLCCTSFGGPRSIPIPPETIQVLLNRTGDPERDLRTFLPLQLATDYLQTHAAEVDAYVAWRVAHPQPLPAYQRQAAAFLAHDAGARLPALRLPVLVLHGEMDRVVPAGNGDLLAEIIPGARLQRLEGVGHNFLWEAADEANRLIIGFLSEDET
ncbi:MAG: alpha/beta fold hydrolase [bacterium]